MKVKIMQLVVAVALSAGMMACNSSAREMKEAKDTQEEIAEASGEPIELGENDILEFGAPQPMPIVVDFWADWCGPCRQLSPIYHEVSKMYAGRVKFLKVNVDKCPEIAKQYGVESIPTLLFVNQQGIINKNIGFMDKDALIGAVESILPDPNAPLTNSPR